MFKCRCSHLTEQPSKKILQRRNKHTLPCFSVYHCFSFSSLCLPPFRLQAQWSFSHPSVICSQALLHQKAQISKWSVSLQLLWDHPASCLESLPWKKVRYQDERRCAKPTYAQKCGSWICCPHLYLAWYSEPYQWFYNDKVIMAILTIYLSDFQLFPTCPHCAPSFP